MGNELQARQMNEMMLNIEYLPKLFENNNSSLEVVSFKLSQLVSIGNEFTILSNVYDYFKNTMGIEGSEGLYRVKFPSGVKGSLGMFKDESNFFGSIVKDNKFVGQARLSPADFDPSMMVIAAVLKNIEKRLDKIEELSLDIFEFLKLKEKAALRGNLNMLLDIIKNYQYNYNNEKYKTNKHIQVQEIRRDAEQSLIFAKDLIERNLKNKSLFHSGNDVKNKLVKIIDNFADLKLSLYLFSFSSFIEVLLLENYNADYLKNVTDSIEGHAFKYRELYSDCYASIELASKTSIDSHLISGFANLNKALGNASKRVPLLNKTQFDEALNETGNKIEQFGSKLTKEKMTLFIESSGTNVQPFIDNVNAFNTLYNSPIEIQISHDDMRIVRIEE